MQVGTTKDQGLYSKPSAAVHPGALAAGTLPQYTIQSTVTFVSGYQVPNNRPYNKRKRKNFIIVFGI